MIMSLYENHFPLRFGVILYSSKFIKSIEINGGELHSPVAEDDSPVIEDISSLVFSLYSHLLFFRLNLTLRVVLLPAILVPLLSVH